MKRLLVDFVAHRSVIVELHDDDDDDEAVQKAEQYLNQHDVYVSWEFDNNIEETDLEPDVKIVDN